MEHTVRAEAMASRGAQAVPRPAPADPALARLATRAIVAALLVGVVGDALMHTGYLGINLFLWAVAALAAAAWIARQRGHELPRRAWVFALPVLFFAGVFAWRDAEFLLVLSMLSMLVGFGMLAFALGGWPPSLVRARVLDYMIAAASVGVSGIVGAPLLAVQDGAFSSQESRPRRTHVVASLRGLVLAVPILLVFGALLVSADARFERLIDSIFAFDLGVAVSHVAFAGFVAWVTAGWLRAALVARRPLGAGEPVREIPRMTLGIIELAVPLGLLDILFLAFVVLQLPYLFGGAAHVQSVAGLTVAEYARRGFYQLIVVAALVLPLLLAASALVRVEERSARRLFGWLAASMLVLVAVMLVSALRRMQLYAATFGLTEDRIYATAIMLWLALVLALFAATGLRGRATGFVLGAVVSGWMVVALLDVVNPQALVVRVNAERAVQGERFDVQYLTSLGPDAVPALMAATARVNEGARCVILGALEKATARRAQRPSDDWRSWNASRARALGVARAAPRTSSIPGCATPGTP